MDVNAAKNKLNTGDLISMGGLQRVSCMKSLTNVRNILKVKCRQLFIIDPRSINILY